ncbi:MAG: hypothetical protein FHP92_09060 [Denitromonas halophila]|uniref:SPOR domain-containing protein n=1 Tax=Denitromonas halophila TaxID=1629404 RepID=A0A558EST4_9RHOO|nr:hypothetical protein [Denitromonas halophila]TVO58531.1 hypothetical protein FHP91_02350 [Denitromonas halophila]TVT76168.1 MAG: hypothetical protein FHP92_09060 [Denitromonas halophila]
MTKTVTGDFSSKDAMENVLDDLVSVGIPRENVFLATEQMQVKVITPDVTEREVTEILMRHNPTKMH